MKSSLFFVAAALLLATAAQASTTNRVTVTAPSGPVIGETVVASYRTIARFLGVPYAQPPKRFRRPVPVEKWSQPIEAVKWPANCYQNLKHPFNDITKSLILSETISEDCLYLNIWSPNVTITDEAHLKPVIVWIHGGALLLGSSALSWYDGETLASKADAVVVSINYRLSGHGFLYSDEVEEVKGNQGLWDQAMALEFIQENIKYFGGDPNSVTISGESAGSWSVSAQVLSPVARKYFHNGIIMSGATINSRVAIEPKEAVRRWLKAIRQVGCADASDTSISQKVIECLEKAPAEKVDEIGYLVSEGHGELPPLITVDGHFLPDTPENLLAKGNYKTDIRLLVDTVKDEGSFMFFAADPRFHRENPAPISLAEAKDFFFHALGDNVKSYPKEAISKLYFDKLNADNEDADLYRRQVGIAFGDFLLGCPTLHFAKQVYKHSPNTATVYQWYYTAKLGRNKVLDGKWADTAHTDDIFAVFGGPFRQPKWFHNRERDISREVIAFIANFIRTGEPGDAHPEWQSYFMAPDGQEVIAPYYEVGNDHATADSYRYNLKQVECELIWNRLEQ